MFPYETYYVLATDTELQRLYNFVSEHLSGEMSYDPTEDICSSQFRDPHARSSAATRRSALF
jgi:hypothetical protein